MVDDIRRKRIMSEIQLLEPYIKNDSAVIENQGIESPFIPLVYFDHDVENVQIRFNIILPR